VAGVVWQAQTAVKPAQPELMPSTDHSTAAVHNVDPVVSVVSNVVDLPQVGHSTELVGCHFVYIADL